MAEPVRIRSARPEERAALEALQWRASLSNPQDRDVLLAHPDAIELPAEQIGAGHVLVAEIDGSAAGFAVVLPRDGGEAELDGLFVEPDRFGRGLGRALVDAAAQMARARGAVWLHVIANQQAEGFYRRCGFEAFGTAQTRFGPANTLRRRL